MERYPAVNTELSASLVIINAMYVTLGMGCVWKDIVFLPYCLLRRGYLAFGGKKSSVP